MTPSRPNVKKWLLPAVKVLIVVLLVWFIRGTLSKAWRQIEQQQWHLDIRWLACAGGIYSLGLLPAGLFWHRALRVLGQEAQLGETLRAYYIGHLGKYVPGKAMVVILRAGLIRSHRVHAGVAAASVFYETLINMAVGACIAAGVLAVEVREERGLFWLSIGMMLLAGLPTLPPVFARLARLAGVGKSDPTIAEKLSRVGYGTLLLGWAASVVVWICMGLSLWAIFRAMGIDNLGPLEYLSDYTGSVAFGIVAGFVAMIPGGVGVREIILLKLIVRLFGVGEGAAAVAAGLLRLVWLLSEVVVSIILYVVGICFAGPRVDIAARVKAADQTPADR